MQLPLRIQDRFLALETGSKDATLSMQCYQSLRPVKYFFFCNAGCYDKVHSCYERAYDGPVELSRDDWEALLVRGAKVGSTRDEGGNSLNQPITILDRSSSSKSICATPIKDL